MPTPSAIFDEQFAPKVRYVPPTDLKSLFDDQTDAFRKWLETLKKSAVQGRPFVVHVDYVDDGSFNAFATEVGGEGYVGINKGMMLLPLDLFARLFSHPQVLPKLASASLEVVGPQHSEGILNDFDTLVKKRRERQQPDAALPPIHPARQLLSSVCMHVAWDFLSFHELAHVIHGHCGYWLKRNGLNAIVDSATQTSTSSDPLIRQAIEVYADSVAISQSLNRVLSIDYARVGVHFPLTPLLKMYLWCYAIFGVFRIWGLEIPLTDLDNRDYPPTSMRYAMAIDTAKLHLKNYHPELEEQFFDICGHAEIDFDMHAVHIGAKPVKIEAVADVVHHISRDHMNRVLGIMRDELTPALAPFRYIVVKGA